MPEGFAENRVEGGGEPSMDGLSVIMKELGLSTEIQKQILNLDQSQRERCIIDLEDIVAEVKEKNIGNADRDKKIKETLASEYGIITTGIIIDGNPDTNGSNFASKIDVISNNENLRQLELANRLQAVKSLDPTLIDSKIQSAKTEQPLPENVKSNIAKATGITPDTLDATIASGNNPLVNNLVDTYYLTYAEESILKGLPNGGDTEARKAFSNLRASAREYGVLAEFQSKDLDRNIADKSNRSQELIRSGAMAITSGRGDIPIIREGERLFFKSPNGKEITHSMDISKIPPVVTKYRGSIEVRYEVPDTRDREVQAKYQTELDDNKRESKFLTTKITSDHGVVEKRLLEVKQDAISIQELSEAIRGIEDANSLEKRKEQSEKIISLCERALGSEAFEPKTEIKGDILSSSEGFHDYFYGQKIRAIELRKKFEDEGIISGKIRPNQAMLSNPNDIEFYTSMNLNGLENMGISQFASMSEVQAFLMSVNGPEIGNRWIGPDEINNSLTSEGIPRSMWEKLINTLAIIHDQLSGGNIREKGYGDKVLELQKSDGNGKMNITSLLQNYRITKKGGSNLTKQDFESLLSEGRNNP